MQPETPLPLQQHRFFAQTLIALGQPASLNPMQFAAPVMTIKRFGMSFASRGPIWQNDATEPAKCTALRNSGLVLINADRFEPNVYRDAGFRLVTTPAWVAELDLWGTAHQRLLKAKGKWRNVWRRAQHSLLTIQQELFDPQLHQWLLDADRVQQRQKGFRALPHAIIAAYAAKRPQDVVIFIARQNQKPVAAMLFLLHQPVATYHLGWSNDTGRVHGAHHRILFEAADVFSDKGYRRLDIGTVDTENAPGLARFKIGTGAVVRPLGGTWLKVPGL